MLDRMCHVCMRHAQQENGIIVLVWLKQDF